MKNLSFLFALAFVIMATGCGKDGMGSEMEAVQVPDPILKAFDWQYPEARKVKWWKGDKRYLAMYQENNMEREIIYDLEGKVLVFEKEIHPEDLPATVTSYLDANYSGQKVHEAEWFKNENGAFWEVTLKIDSQELELVFDEAGNYLERKLDEDDEDDEDDDDDQNEDDED